MTLEDRTCKRGPIKVQDRDDGEKKQYGMVGRAQNGVLIVSQSLSSFLIFNQIIGPLFL